jgi:hypothetical protein
MQLFALPETALYIFLGWLILLSLPALGCRVLRFLREWDEYRDRRPRS